MNTNRSLMVGSALVLCIGLAGCGVQPKSATPSHPDPILTIHIKDVTRLATLPITIAEKLGFFQKEHLAIDLTSKTAAVTIAPAGTVWPIQGYLASRPDLVLISPMPDPHFRLRALNALPIIYSHQVQPQQSLAESILARHHAHVSAWNRLSFHHIETLWKRHHLPWALVTLNQAVRLQSVDPKSVILTWLGASTGDIPSIVISASPETPKLVPFFKALNLALWYLYTTPSGSVARALAEPSTSSAVWSKTIADAVHYRYWPATTFPDATLFNRSRAVWSPTWPTYQKSVDPALAKDALKESGS